MYRKYKLPMLISEFEIFGNDVDFLLSYPGSRPSGSFLTDGKSINGLPSQLSEFYQSVNAYLGAKKLPLLEHRIPVLAYGANASPARFQRKIQNLSTILPKSKKLLETVPYLLATVPDTVAAWHGWPGKFGSVFAELLKDENTLGAEMIAHVSFITPEQLAVLHVTEGKTYTFTHLLAMLGAGRGATKVYAYVASDSSLSISDGKPILVSGIEHLNTQLTTQTARQRVTEMLENVGIFSTPEDFVLEGLAMAPNERDVRQKRIGDKLLAAKRAKLYIYQGNDTDDLFATVKYQFMNNGPELILAPSRPNSAVISTLLPLFSAEYPDLSDNELRKMIQGLIGSIRISPYAPRYELTNQLISMGKV